MFGEWGIERLGAWAWHPHPSSNNICIDPCDFFISNISLCICNVNCIKFESLPLIRTGKNRKLFNIHSKITNWPLYLQTGSRTGSRSENRCFPATRRKVQSSACYHRRTHFIGECIFPLFKCFACYWVLRIVFSHKKWVMKFPSKLCFLVDQIVIVVVVFSLMALCAAVVLGVSKALCVE